ncbi:X8 domain containing protein [Parasponia andersonii]|uniref:X8 domain containing protein n=1 Tax=Parasponia andersonii TaxID=3476 RepID=A0A2P5ATS1_PARAD|nr:X8 domain containing protein [Parasponia andersonii]
MYFEANIDFICGHLSDCSEIKEPASCFLSNTLMNHASVIMNLYYRTLGNYHCDFNNTGATVLMIAFMLEKGAGTV